MINEIEVVAEMRRTALELTLDPLGDLEKNFILAHACRNG
jgi:hypothetical protein